MLFYQVYEEGTHLMIPGFEWPIIYDVRARPNVIQSTSGSRDLQMVCFRPSLKLPHACACYAAEHLAQCLCHCR